jgi:uroporphyrinogen decarboxylase
MLFFHSCGAIGEIVPDLIDCGVDILNPGSPSARGMDMARLKRDFGRDLVLWGPGLGAGEIRGLSPADAAARTRRFLDAMAAGGGFVFAPAQDLPSDFPAEILLATIGAAAGPPISPRA